MAKYRHSTRGASAADVLLAVDKSKEDYEELRAYEAYLEKLRKQAKKKRRWGGLGSLFGAIGGFLIGGPVGMMKGYTAGKSIGTIGAAHDDYKDNKRALRQKVWGGGKFNASDMTTRRDQLKRAAKEQQKADLVGIGIDAVTTMIGVKGAGGAMDAASKQAWQDLAFKDKISMALKMPAKEISNQMKDVASIKAGDTTKNVLDLVASRNAVLKSPVDKFNWKQPVKSAFKGAGNILGAVQNPGTSVGEMMRLANVQNAIRRGDVTLGAMLFSDMGPWSSQGYKKGKADPRIGFGRRG
jgi:hypothetical protein